MSTFSISPVGGFPPAEPTDFPEFIQFQAEGENLGGPDADTVNFTGGAVATRGVGEDAGVVTVNVAPAIQFQEDGVDLGAPDVTTVNFAANVTAVRTGDTIDVSASGGGGGADTLSVVLNPFGSGDWDASDYDDWDGVVAQQSADASWDNGTELTLTTPGLYELNITGNLIGDTGVFPTTGEVIYGSYIPEALGPTYSVFSRTNEGRSPNTYPVQWTDRYLVLVTTPISLLIRMYADVTDPGYGSRFSGFFSATRLSGTIP